MESGTKNSFMKNSDQINLHLFLQDKIDYRRDHSNEIKRQWSLFCESLIDNKSLYYLDFNGMGLGPKELAQLCKSLALNSIISHIDLSKNCIGSDGVKIISQCISHCKISHLDLSDNEIDESSLKHLSAAVLTNKSLVHLNLSENDLGEGSIEFLCRSILESNVLQYFDLSCNSLNSEACLSLGPLGLSTSLIELILSGNSLMDDGIKLLLKCFKLNQSLKALDLSDNCLSSKSCKYISQILSYTNIQSLDMSANEIDSTGLIELSFPIKNESKLSILKIHSNKICSEGLKVFSENILDNFSLKYVDLRDNLIDYIGINCLSELIKGKRSGLTEICLTYNKLCSKSILALSKALKSKWNMKSLKFSLPSNNFNEQLKVMAHDLKFQNKKIEYLELKSIATQNLYLIGILRNSIDFLFL